MMAQVLAKYHSLPSAERDNLSPVFAGVRVWSAHAHNHVHEQRAMHVHSCTTHGSFTCRPLAGEGHPGGGGTAPSLALGGAHLYRTRVEL